MRRSVLALSLCFLLACAGIVQSLAPEPKVPPPVGAQVQGFEANADLGGSRRQLTYGSEAAPGEVIKYYTEVLNADGWTVVGTEDSLAATKDQQAFSVSFGAGTFETVWTGP